ncbi:chaplin [Streptomyces sp. NPDC055966]|uniref:chaplin n=1 Tax=Streptomyces sp. NPDC055966 TaxID=3345669 RepID=UPI0035E088F1
MRVPLALSAAALTALAVIGCAGAAAADDGAFGVAKNSPGVVSGNVIQVPVEVDANVCGNTINVVGLLNPAHGNVCVNE